MPERSDPIGKIPDILVIGAGIIGISSALELQSQGLKVLVLDRSGIAAEASRGNAGAFAFSDIMPLATPGIMGKTPKWLMDPLGPLSVPIRYAPHIAPWLWKFWRASRKGRMQAGAAAQTALMDLSRDSLPPFMEATGTRSMLHQDGNLQLYESIAEFTETLPAWKLRENHGIPFRHIKGIEAIAEIQPGLSRRFIAGTFTPEWYRISDPLDYAEKLADIFVARGGRIQISNVEAVRVGGDEGAIAILTDGAEIRARKIVICAGAWSHRLARTLGDNIPLETERGYNTTLPKPSFVLKTQLTFGGHGFVITRIGDDIRIGGAVELGGLQAKPNFKRADALLAKAMQFLPDLSGEGGTQWMGFRPSLPDSLPVIGTTRHSNNIIYAFGHGHLGLTQSTGTARLVGELVSGHKSSIDLTSFSPYRF